MKKQSWIVEKKGLPCEEAIEAYNIPKDECIYCHQKIGTEHKCCIRRRTVVMKFTIEDFVTIEPEDWTPKTIESHYNESSYCADNVIDLFVEAKDRLERGCFCGRLKAEYVREADAEDEASSRLFISKTKEE